jgi:hypothetical protein
MKPLLFLVLCSALASAAETVRVRISFGHQAKQAAAQFIRLTTSGGLELGQPAGVQLEAGESFTGGALEFRAGGGDIDGVQFDLVRKGPASKRIDNLHIIWSDLIASAPPDMARRLATDASMFANPGKLTVQMNREGTRGFSVTLEQLQQNRTMWIPSLDVYIAAGESPAGFRRYQPGHRRRVEGTAAAGWSSGDHHRAGARRRSLRGGAVRVSLGRPPFCAEGRHQDGADAEGPVD